MGTASSDPRAERETEALAKLAIAHQHSNAGYLTRDDREFLLSNPKYTNAVIDPAKTTEGGTTTFTPYVGSSTSRTQAVGCFASNRYQNYYTAANVKVWEYHIRGNWCNKLIIGSSGSTYAFNGTPTFDSYFAKVNAYWTPASANTYSYGRYTSSTQYRAERHGQIKSDYVTGGTIYPKNNLYMNASGTSSFGWSR